MSVLSRCTRLHTLAVRSTRLLPTSSAHPDAVPEVRMPTLHSLHLYPHSSSSSSSTQPGDWLTSRLTLPNLRHLSISGMRLDVEIDFTSVLEMLERSDSDLEELTVSEITMMDVTISRILQHRRVRQVQRLTLEGHPLAFLFSSLLPPEMLPKLRALNVRMQYENGRVVLCALPIKHILRLVQARKEQLDVVNLELCQWHGISELVELGEEIQRLKAHGRPAITVRHLTNAELEQGSSPRLEILVIIELGMLIKQALMGGGVSAGYRSENIFAIDEIFTDLETRIRSATLNNPDQLSLKSVYYVLLAIANEGIIVPDGSDLCFGERAREVLAAWLQVPGGLTTESHREGKRNFRGSLGQFEAARRKMWAALKRAQTALDCSREVKRFVPLVLSVPLLFANLFKKLMDFLFFNHYLPLTIEPLNNLNRCTSPDTQTPYSDWCYSLYMKTVKRSATHYWELVVFQVEDELFRVPRQQFADNPYLPSPLKEIFYKSSPPQTAVTACVSSKNAKTPGDSDEDPIVLKQVSKVDFERLMEFLYPSVKQLVSNGPGMNHWSTKVWLSVLRLATLWNFLDVRELVIKHLDLQTDLEFTYFEAIAAAREFSVPSWFRVALEAIGKDIDGDIALETDAQRIGLPTTIRLYHLKGKIRKARQSEGDTKGAMREGISLLFGSEIRAIERKSEEIKSIR
ncbi:hypothetical protein V5O48_011089 [Marasmius crinis-equi]|uniref:Uncharacterized protein n=1 Tax=Marasmius crinis-equi TaxID=585013 RepID=A0ABR3F6I3_9AGAR